MAGQSIPVHIQKCHTVRTAEFLRLEAALFMLIIDSSDALVIPFLAVQALQLEARMFMLEINTS